MRHMTDEEYVKEEGTKCPYCKSLNIERIDPVGFDETISWKTVICNNCGERWSDIFELTGYVRNEG